MSRLIHADAIVAGSALADGRVVYRVRLLPDDRVLLCLHDPSTGDESSVRCDADAMVRVAS